MHYACCVADDVRHHTVTGYGPLGKHEYILCRHYCARAVVFGPHLCTSNREVWDRVCVCVCVCTKPETMSTKHSVSPESLHTLNLYVH